jgi:protein-L-isoaspartate(D-aspartate) O-methyltransferase
MIRGIRLSKPIVLLFSFALLFGQQDEGIYAKKRQEMVKEQLKGRDITSPKVLDVMAKIPRHLFVDAALRLQAYEDYPLPIGEGQTISQPYIVAFMTQVLDLKGNERVLEIGTGSGYQAAVLASLAERVYSIEINEVLAKRASETLRRLRLTNVEIKCGDGFFGWPEEAPFDAVIVTCAPSRTPSPLFEQLREGGRMIVPLGESGDIQVLTLIGKTKGKAKIREILPVRFVPMTGENLRKKK